MTSIYCINIKLFSSLSGLIYLFKYYKNKNTKIKKIIKKIKLVSLVGLENVSPHWLSSSSSAHLSLVYTAPRTCDYCSLLCVYTCSRRITHRYIRNSCVLIWRKLIWWTGLDWTGLDWTEYFTTLQQVQQLRKIHV